MAVFKCKMCGGELDIHEGASVAECEYCGSKQTLPKLNNERKIALYERANHFRRNNDYDKAMGVYEQILNEDETDAETYWSLVLCKYGIEYVEDPATKKRVPTCNRTQFVSVFADEDYKSAIKYASSEQRELYENEAKEIDKIQKGILEISSKEEPFDVFICYKEIDSSGQRTKDSVLAQELYYGLTEVGFKVFFSKITLENKLGSQYEPYIFAALNSAKVMVAVGTKPEYFNAPWVKNEWSRYLALMKTDKSKMLIPAYRDMDPYDMPEEFSLLQGQDMSKLGFMQDIIRGIKKIMSATKPKEKVIDKSSVKAGEGATTSSILMRAFMFLEDGEFDNANEYAEKILDINPKLAEAYLIKLLIDLKLTSKNDLKTYSAQSYNSNKNYQKVLRFADENLKKEIVEYSNNCNNEIKRRQEEKAKEEERKRRAQAERLRQEAEAEKIREEKERIRQQEEDRINAIKRKKSNIIASVLIVVLIAIVITSVMVTTYINEDGIVYKKNGNSFSVYKIKDKENRQEITIQSEIQGKPVVGILPNAFKNCSSLTSVTIPNSVKSIGWNAFEGCSSLTSIVIPESVTNLDDYIFSNCTSLKSISIPSVFDSFSSIIGDKTFPEKIIINGGTKIDKYDFYNCNSITEIVVSDSITDIADWAFDNCDSLTKITMSRTYGEKPLGFEKKIKNIIITGGKSIKDGSFAYCKNLKSVIIPDSVISIGKSAFLNCSSLENIIIPDNVNEIGYSAFNGCRALKSITIPDSVIEIGDNAFNECASLTAINVMEDNPNYRSIDGNLYTKDGKKLIQYACGKIDANFAISENVIEISDSAFEGCASLQYVTIPYSVNKIGDKAFAKCTSLTTINVMEDNPNYRSIDGNLYTKDGQVLVQYAYGKIATNFDIPGGTTVIGDHAFYGCSTLNSIIIPDSVVNISFGAFKDCSSLTNVTIPNSVKYLSIGVFEGCSSLTSIVIPNSITSIKWDVFRDCTSLVDVTIPNSVTSIGNDAFYGCTSLVEITIPNSVTSIDGGAFFRCSSLTNITIPNSVTYIGWYAFCDCKSLTSIIIPSSVITVDEDAFKGCENLTIYAETSSKPSGWNEKWNPDDRPVVWGYKG